MKEIFCPDCGCSLIHMEGCLTCPKCGWSECERTIAENYEYTDDVHVNIFKAGHEEN